MKEWFLKLKPSAVLLLLKDSQQQWYPSKLARAANCSYVHAVNLLAAMRKNGIVELEKKGRQSIYRLTERGNHLAMALDEFSKKCDAASAASASSQQEEASRAKAEREAAHEKQDGPAGAPDEKN